MKRTIRFFARGFAAAFAFAAAATLAAPPQILTAPRGPVNDRVPDFVRSGANAVRFNSDELLSLAPGQEVQLTLPNAKRHAFVFELREAHGNGIYSWIGKHKERGNHNRAIVTTGPTGSFGVFYTPEGEYRLIPGNGHDWLVDMTAEAPAPINLGDDALEPRVPKTTQNASYAPETMVRMPGVNSLAVTQSTPTPQYVVDLMIVYTNGLAANLGANLMTRLYNIVTIANTAYADSEVAMTLRLVGAVGVNYSDATSDSAALGAISPSEGTFDAATFGTIEAARTANGADLVALFRNGSSFGGSGLAWVGNSSPNTMPTYMYSVTTGCVAGCESVMIHELGHNMGNKHDRATTSWQAGGTPSPSGGAYAYSFGYAFCKSGLLTCDPTTPGGCASQPECSTSDPSNFADIMAYFQGTATKILKFSNPNVNCATPSGDLVPRPCGVSEALANSANTALSMNNNRAAISAVKSTVASQPQAGSLQFTSTASAAPQSTGSITFNVSRLGGSSGAVSASYSTQNGSAIAGVDYTASSGNVSWANGETANKSIVVPLISNGATNGSTFTVNLSNPSGTSGVFLGYPATATGVIQVAWPPGGTMPTGFVTPGTSSGAWTTATDQAYEGTTSLRSASVYGNGDFTTYNTSDLSYTGTFAPGTLSFAYRVSSYPNYGIFQFLVDGSVVYTDAGGETGWKVYVGTMAAGSHTLLWRYANRLPQPCNAGWDPPPPGGGSCSDRVWIDSVTLPLLGAPAIASVLSRKTHGSFGPTTLDQPITTGIPIAGAVSVEPRQISTGHQLVFTFDQNVNLTSFVTCTDASGNPVGSVSSPVISGPTLTVSLTGVPDNQRVTVTVINVDGTGTNRSATLGFLVGDVNGSRSVTASDILMTKGKPGAIVDNTTYMFDPNLTKAIDSTDLALVKANAGQSIP